MRKSPILAVLALSLVAPSASARNDEDPWYLQFGVGLGTSSTVDGPTGSEVDFDLGYATSIALGRTLGRAGAFEFAVEGEGLYTYFTVDERDLASFPNTKDKGASSGAVLANLVVDYNVSSGFALYLAGGAGFGSINYSTFDTGNLSQQDNSGSVAQFKAGMRYKLGSAYHVSLGYRYYITDEIDVFDQASGNTTSIDYSDNILELGFRWGI